VDDSGYVAKDRQADVDEEVGTASVRDECGRKSRRGREREVGTIRNIRGGKEKRAKGSARSLSSRWMNESTRKKSMRSVP
jgi:hypothetical protein